MGENHEIDEHIKISILVPVYGVEKYIEKCCKSLFEQSYENIEYVFVDDCSPDNSISILNETLSRYPTRKANTKIIRHQNNRGLSAARNTALDNATGNYIMHVDSDDYLDKDTTQNLINIIIKENADAVIFSLREIYNNKVINIRQKEYSCKDDYIKAILQRTTPVCMCGGCYKISLFKETGIQSIEGLNFGEDYVVKPRLLYNAKKIVFAPNIYYNYVQYNNQSYTSSFNIKQIEDLKKALNILSDYFKDVPEHDIYLDAIYKATTNLKFASICDWAINHREQVVITKINNSFILRNGDGHSQQIIYKIFFWINDKKLYMILRLFIIFGKYLIKFKKNFGRLLSLLTKNINIYTHEN